MKFNIKTIFAIILITTLSCDDNFENVNTNPNQPEEVSSDVLITNATRSSMNSMVTESFLLSNNIAQISAKTLRSEVDEYNWNAFSTLWLQQYIALTDLVDAENIAVENEQVANQAASIVMQSWIFYTLTMAYGDIPYSEAISGLNSDNFTPVYDSQQDILDGENGLIARLDEAINLFGQTNLDVEGDLIYDGNTSQWVKLANVLKLRILLHLSNKRDVSSEMQAIVNNGMLFSGNADNATLNYLSSFPNDFPLFPLKQGDFDAVVMSESSVEKFQEYNDPRLGAYARPDNVTDLETFDSPAATYSGAE
ncbi:MAG: SusD/RagB family nutrient-binding outer membrane lipoprotein, partial [Psychroflexus sp.]|nr:SusD/RagB family nutrient-binding outer membrane lipoprotein [Psychroflexus sp.]